MLCILKAIGADFEIGLLMDSLDRSMLTAVQCEGLAPC